MNLGGVSTRVRQCLAPSDRVRLSAAAVDPIRVVLVTNVSSQSSLPLLKRLATSPQVEVAHVLFFDTIAAGKRRLPQVLHEHGIAGTLGKANDVLRQTVKTWAMRRCEWLNRGHCYSSHEFAVARGIPHTVVPTVNGESVTKLLTHSDVDILLVCSCSEILRSELLLAPKIGAVNVHFSLLPKYRGPAPAFWALYYRESETGVTFHLMTSRVDAGAILAQFRVRIDPKWNEPQLMRRLCEEAAAHATDVLQSFALQRIQPRPQEDHKADYHSHPTPSQRRDLGRRRRSGRSLRPRAH